MAREVNAIGEIDEILVRKDLKEQHNALVLGHNAKRYYKIS